jgi:outer membrane protein assembly factor BamB
MNRAVRVFLKKSPGLRRRVITPYVSAGISLAVTLGCLATSTSAADWPTFRGPNASGVAEGPAPTTGELLYLVSNNGVVSAYQIATGERVYQQRLSPNQGTVLSASPVYADGKLYFPSEDGDVFVVKAGDKYELLSTNPVGEVLMATPAISDGTIFIRGEHSVFAIREKAK